MDLERFLKPDYKKVLLFLVFIVPTSVISNLGFGVWWTGVDIGINYGFPFSFYGYGGGPPLEPDQPTPTYFHPLSLIGNTVFWYLLSCLIIWIYERKRSEINSLNLIEVGGFIQRKEAVKCLNKERWFFGWA